MHSTITFDSPKTQETTLANRLNNYATDVLVEKVWYGERTTRWLPHKSATAIQPCNCGRPCCSHRPHWRKNKTNKRTIHSGHALQVHESVAERKWHHSKRNMHYHQNTSPDWSYKPWTTIHYGIQYIKRIRKTCSGRSYKKHNDGNNSINASSTDTASAGVGYSVS